MTRVITSVIFFCFSVLLTFGCSEESPTAPATGSVVVSATTTGEDVPNAYTLIVGEDWTQSIESGGTATVSDLAPGDYSVELSDIPTNCAATSANPVGMAVEAGKQTTTVFSVHCGANIGALGIQAFTIGDDLDPNGYMVSIGGIASHPIPPNGSVTIDDIPAGEHMVVIADVAANCEVLAGDSITATVPYRGSAQIAFTIDCYISQPRIAYTHDVGGVGRAISAMNMDGSGVAMLSPHGVDAFGPDWSPDGKRLAFAVWLYASSDRNGIGVVRANGKDFVPIVESMGYFQSPKWSPDGSRIAFVRSDEMAVHGAYLWVVNADGSDLINLSSPLTTNGRYSWSPDGTRIVFANDRAESSGDHTIYIVNADGSGLTRLTSGNHVSWSPVGDRIAFEASRGIRLINADGSDEKVVVSGFDNPVWFPDGSRLAVRDIVNSRSELHGVSADGYEAGLMWLAYCQNPTWSPDGLWIACEDIDREGDETHGTWAIRTVASDSSSPSTLISDAAGPSRRPDWSPSLR